jgi:hypothetical protein
MLSNPHEPSMLQLPVLCEMLQASQSSSPHPAQSQVRLGVLRIDIILWKVVVLYYFKIIYQNMSIVEELTRVHVVKMQWPYKKQWPTAILTKYALAVPGCLSSRGLAALYGV